MTSHTARLYALAVSVLALFLAWAAVATHPWQSQAAPARPDPRMRALVVRQHHLAHRARVVRRIVARRWHSYRVALRHREHQIRAAKRRHRLALAAAARAAAAQQAAAASYTPSYSSPGYSAPAAAPQVQIVHLPAQTVTRTS